MNNSGEIDFGKGEGLVPAIIQDVVTKEVLMLGYMNELSYQKTLETEYVHFWSRSRNELWLKGETSGNKLKIVDMAKDCDSDTLLIQVKLEGKAVCHTGERSCFYTKII